MSRSPDDAADVVIVGAGIAGVAVAYHLAVKHEVRRIILVDPRSPLSLTSDKSTECYRNWWPTKPMVGLMNRSIDLLDQADRDSGHGFGLNRRGYLFATADPTRFRDMVEEANHISMLGAGPVRTHPGPIPYRKAPAEGVHGAPEGADVFLGSEEVKEHFPFLSDHTVGAVQVRRAGWFSAQQLGAWMLDQARGQGVELVVDEVTSIEIQG
ncbi:MAG TPA: FAD-dependent oxidoreductase, partial [Acidimicrobiia bacterium]|nr:FAD-dependent oxidoreductase [Acidimicrobiia bacterium]